MTEEVSNHPPVREASVPSITRWLKWGWLLSLLVLVLQFAIYYDRLPQRIASHFNAAGQPDDWSDKAEFALVWFGCILVVNIWVPLIPWVMRKFPRSLVNLPNKDYWYETPQRFQAMLGILMAMIYGIFLAVNLLLAVIAQYTFDVNLEGSSDWNIWVALAIHMSITLTLVIWGLVKLSRTPKAASPS